jgi:hypothetical protein
MTPQSISGQCLCGSVRFEARPPYSAFRYCHCSRCRKASGSAHAANLFLPEGQFAWTAGEELINRYSPPGAKTFAVWFCTRCGSRVPHRVALRQEFLIPAGLLENDPAQRPQHSIFWDSRAPWYIETHDLPKFADRP